MNENIKTLVAYISSLAINITTHVIEKLQISLLLDEEIFILAKYSNFANVFLNKSAKILPKDIEAQKHIIKLENDKELSYTYIYNLRLAKVETLKIYIQINLNNGLIKPSKLPIGASIFFI